MSQWRILDSSSGSRGNPNIQNNNIIEVRNPVLRRPKGHPKSKRDHSSLESNTKAYRCKLCKQVGHNSKTCKGKENQVRRES